MRLSLGAVGEDWAADQVGVATDEVGGATDEDWEVAYIILLTTDSNLLFSTVRSLLRDTALVPGLTAITESAAAFGCGCG